LRDEPYGEARALSAARQPKADSSKMLFAATIPPVKMCLERPAGRDKHENKNGFSAEDAQQRRRPPPAAETGRSCWGSGQQDASAAQGTKRMLGAATRKTRRAF